MDIKDVKAEIESAIPISLLAGTRERQVQCPFHLSKDPDVKLHHDTNMWRCFGACDDGKWHSIYDWVMWRDGVDYTTALKTLAEEAGVSFGPNQDRTHILAAAQNYYYNQLLAAPHVLEYLHKRGFSDELIYQRQIGYAPNGCFPTGVSIGALCDVGLIRTGIHKHYAFFSDRIVYPVYDHQFNLVQMQGRLVGNPEVPEGKYLPKYLSLSSDTELKGRSIYQCLGGEEILKREGLSYAFLCEGWPDRETLTAWRLNALNLFGHSGMEKHASRLKLIKKIYVVLDPDVASQGKLLNNLYALAIKIPEVEFFVIDLQPITNGLDLNDWAMTGKPPGELLSPKRDQVKIDRLREACTNAKPFPRLLIEQWASRPHLVELVARFISRLPDSVSWIGELAKALGQSPQTIEFLIQTLLPEIKR